MHSSPSCKTILSGSEPRTNTAITEPDVTTAAETRTREDSHVYVHGHVRNGGTDMLIRIWKTTFLVDVASGSKSGLIHAENITLAPQWTRIPNGSDFSFLLIFSALPKTCQRFDLREEIPQPGGFRVSGIPRNETDVYHVDIL
jgi:hypothetical protein